MHRTLDTLDIVKSLINNGMKPELAEDVARAIGTRNETDLSNVASKADLKEVDNKIEKHVTSLDHKFEQKISATERRLDEKIFAVQTELCKTGARLSMDSEKLRAEIAKTKSEIIVWFVSTAIAIVAAIAVLLKLFIH